MTTSLRPMRFDGERRYAVALPHPDDVERASARIDEAEGEGAALVYGFVDPAAAPRVWGALGFTSLGEVPELVRPLRLGSFPLLLPFQRARRPGVREITVREPRVTRLWDRFSIDVLAALERTSRWIDPTILENPSRTARVFVFEDGDRYVIRALCIFRVAGGRGEVLELLHDRSVAGMRAASHLLGLALRELHDAGATEAVAWSLSHSGTFPILVRHAFVPRSSRALTFGVRALDRGVLPAIRERAHWYLSLLDRPASP